VEEQKKGRAKWVITKKDGELVSSGVCLFCFIVYRLQNGTLPLHIALEEGSKKGDLLLRIVSQYADFVNR
jgi:hypothetical protein